MPWEHRLRTFCPGASGRERSSASGASYCKIIVSHNAPRIEAGKTIRWADAIAVQIVMLREIERCRYRLTLREAS